MEFVAFIGEDEKNWGQVSALINRVDAEKIFLVVAKGVNGFPKNLKCEVINVDTGKNLIDLKQEIVEKLKGKLKGEFEVSVSIASGNGKEHMALISALLSVPVGIRLVVFTKKGIEFVN